MRVVRADGGPEGLVPVTRDETVVGAMGDIALREDPFVARLQARFFFSGASLVIEDIGGGNGIFARLKSERELLPGMELRCGRQRLLVEAIPAAQTNGQRIWGSPDTGSRARLIQILEGGRRGDAFLLKEGDNLLGRELGDITFPGDGFVSGRHAVINVRGGRMTVRDVGSSNGTFFRLGGPTKLEAGDQLLIGRQLLKIDIAAA